MKKSLSIEAFCEAICDASRTNLTKILSESLFYYCSGKDPTPVVALYNEFPLFVYSDLMKHRDLYSEAKALEERLKSHGFLITCHKETEILDGAVIYGLSKDGCRLILLFVKGDSWQCYQKIYGEEVLPKCFANYRYEMNAARFLGIQRKAQFILGHSHGEEHSEVRKIKYYGDYGGNEVTLYEMR